MDFPTFLSKRSADKALPAPADERHLQLGLERWQEALAESVEAEGVAPADPVDPGLLAALFGNSPFLTQCCLKEPAFLIDVVQLGPDHSFAELTAGLNVSDASETRPALMRRLRAAKRRTALLTAIADITGFWTLEQVTGALSHLAESTLSAAIEHLLLGAAAAGQIALEDPARPQHRCGLIVLGMGKLGARELNYSSDIDLILLFDPERVRYVGKDSVQALFARFARDLVRILDERTGDGYVFRTDLRLRPDPGSTPPVVSLPAALAYYESAGQNWERAAMIKARPVAGDIEAGFSFLREMRPFLWRRNLDFAAIQDIHSIKRQINAHRGGDRIAVAGHNVKLGRGGIREIEFFAQTQQLIWGGRMPELREPTTCGALRALANFERIQPDVAEKLIECYGFLRKVEHRIQMVDDQQTHTLPTDPAALYRIARFCGFSDTEAFDGAVRRRLERVEVRYAQLFEDAPELGASGNLVFTGAEDDPDTIETLTRLGFTAPRTVCAAIRGWHHGRYRAMRSQRAREILTELVPPLLESFGATANPDTAFVRFDQFLSKLPAGVQLFSLLYNNPPLLDLVADIMGAAPRLADQVAQQPILLDFVLSEGFFKKPKKRATMMAQLQQSLAGARDFQDVLDIVRRWASDRRFQIGVQLLRGAIDGDVAGAAFADVAETVICGLLPHVEADFARAHGRVPGGGWVVLGLGKLGGREMTVTSDLDLIIIYDADAEAEASDGARPLAVSTYYARLSARLINALTVLTAEGALYEVDTRLRPSGNAGPAASRFAAFERYHGELAWTWEHMALTRARPVAGDGDLGARVMGVIRDVLMRPRDADKLLVDVADMRQRMAAQRPDPPIWELKHLRGGLVDIEFIAQYLELREAHGTPTVLHPNTTTALRALGANAALSPETVEDLVSAMRLWRQTQGLLKLLVADTLDEASASAALKATLARGAGCVDFDALKADMTAAAARARAHFTALVDHPAEAARARLAAHAKPEPKPEPKD